MSFLYYCNLYKIILSITSNFKYFLVIEFYEFTENNCFSSEIGPDWTPAIFDSKAEFDFIKESQQWLSNVENYWIGGYTDAEPKRIIGLSKYKSTPSCNYIYKIIINYVFDDYYDYCKICHRFNSTYNFSYFTIVFSTSLCIFVLFFSLSLLAHSFSVSLFIDLGCLWDFRIEYWHFDDITCVTRQWLMEIYNWNS